MERGNGDRAISFGKPGAPTGAQDLREKPVDFWVEGRPGRTQEPGGRGNTKQRATALVGPSAQLCRTAWEARGPGAV